MELACIADLRTGGAIGPKDASYHEKALVFKEGMKQVVKIAKVTDAEKNNVYGADRFAQMIPDVI